MPGAMRCSSANRRALSASNAPDSTNRRQSGAGMRKSAAHSSASASSGVISPPGSRMYAAFLLCSMMCAASWNRLNHRWSSLLWRALRWIAALRGVSHRVAPLSRTFCNGFVTVKATPASRQSRAASWSALAVGFAVKVLIWASARLNSDSFQSPAIAVGRRFAGG